MFLSPLYLVWALAAAVPIVLHLMRRQPEARVKFAPVALLRRAPVEHSEGRRLRELLLLALRVAALVLLATAFARPFFASGDLQVDGVTVVALDSSMSLSAPGRFERAKQLAHAAVANAPSGHLVGVVTFSDAAHVAAPLSGDRAVAAAAIESTSPGLGGTRYADAIARAAELIAGRAGAIVIVTDLQAGGWERGDRVTVAEGIQLKVEDVGEAVPNLAVTSVRAAGDKVVATVRNFSGEPKDVRVRLLHDEGAAPSTGGAQRSAGETLVNVAPQGAAEVALAGARGPAAAVALEDPEGVQGDNVRYVVLDGGGPPLVSVITGSGEIGRDAFYVDQALKASGAAASPFRVEGLAAGRSETWTPDRLDGAAAVFLLSTRGLDRRGRELVGTYVRKGGGLLVAAGPDVDGSVTADALSGAVSLVAPSNTTPRAEGAPRTVVPVDTRHPMFHAFGRGSTSLGLVRFDRLAEAQGSGCRALARLTTGEPVLLECATGTGRLLVFTSDLDYRWNDFPIHASFVPFLQEVVRYLAGPGAHNQEYLIGDVPQGVAPRPGTAVIPDGSTGGGRRIAVNVDPDESEPARLTEDEFLAKIARSAEPASAGAPGSAREQEDRQHLWRYVVGLMLAVLILESALGARTA
jgi:hypothetical protein